MTPLTKIREAGFDVYRYDEGFTIQPEDELNDNDWHFINRYSAAILEELQTEAEYIEPQPGELVVTAYTPLGNPILILASSPEHAVWLTEHNPQPQPQPKKAPQ